MLGFNKKKQGNRKVEPPRNLKERAAKRNLKPFLIATFVCVLAVSLVAIKKQLNNKILFPITDIEIVSVLKNVNESDIKNIVLRDLKHGFFDIKLNQLAQEINDINWVAQTTLRRVWPNTVEVIVREHQAVAIWDDKTLVSTEGLLFKVPSSSEFNLAKVNGQKDRVKELLLAYSELEQLTDNFGLLIDQLNSVKSGEVKVTYNTGLSTVFALQDKEIQFKRFESLLKTGYLTVKNGNNELNNKAVKSIDLRYSNGFSVVWLEQQTHLIKQAEQLGNGKHHV